MSETIDEPVFILTCGRTGSTLLQRLLNTHHALHIWGEHNGALSGLRMCFEMVTAPNVVSFIERTSDVCRRQVLASEPVLERGNWSIQWYNNFDRRDMAVEFRSFIHGLFATGIKSSARHWGFKEIRYGLRDALFLKRIFSKAKFLVLVREPSIVLRSQLEHFYIESIMKHGVIDEKQLSTQSLQVLRDINMVDGLLGPEFHDSRLSVRYEALITDPARQLGTIASYLGIEMFPVEKVESILSEDRTKTVDAHVTEFIRSWIEGQLAEQTLVGSEINSARIRLGYV